jgi:hypothetical protein
LQKAALLSLCWRLSCASFLKDTITIKKNTMKAFVTHLGMIINDKVFKNVKTRKASVEEYKTLKQYMNTVDETGHCYIYCSEEHNEVMVAHLNPDHSFYKIELHKGS